MAVSFEHLLNFVEHDMRMSHVYQPVMLRVLLAKQGQATVDEIALALLQEDRSQLDYYRTIVTNMVGRVLTKRGLVTRNGPTYQIPNFETLTTDQARQLEQACLAKLSAYVERRGDAIWAHRRQSAGYISGTLRYDILKDAKFRCELCGVSAEERALEVDHILPRKRGGSDDPTNLQALCYQCNAMKRDRDDTDFRAVRAAMGRTDDGCPFCSPTMCIAENELALALWDRFPVTPLHALIVPKRHVADYFDLGMPEVRAIQLLVSEVRNRIFARDATVEGFNSGVNSGEVAGQTIPHAHLHLIPRRRDDHPDPRGGVRAVIPGQTRHD